MPSSGRWPWRLFCCIIAMLWRHLSLIGESHLGKLYVVGTPIGNLEDMTYRAVRVLQQVALVAAEDTRTARVLFARYGIKTRLVSYHEQGQQAAKLQALCRRLAEEDIALISEAGM